MISDAHRLWTMCATLLRAQVSDPVWHTAFEGVHAVGYDGRTITLGVPSALAKERIEGRYLGLVRDALAEAGVPHVELELRIEPPEPPSLWTVPAPSAAPAPLSADRPGAPGGRGIGPGPGGPGGGPLGRPGDRDLAPAGDVELNPRYTFDNFVIGGSNRFAHAAAQSVAEMPARRWNPLFIYGDAGLGKTHLLQAIASYVNDNYPAYRVRYVTSETFLNEFIDSMQSGTRDAFKRRYRDIDVLLVDDVQFFQGKQETLGGVLPHLQPPPPDQPPDRAVVRPGARPDRLRGPAPQPVPAGPAHRHPAARAGDPPGDPPQEGRARDHPHPAGRAGVHRRQHHGQHPGAGGRADPGVRLRQPHPRADHRRPGHAGAGRPPQREPAPADHRAAHHGGGGGAVRLHRRGAPEQAAASGRSSPPARSPCT